MARLGMDVDVVENLGRQLKNQAGQLGQIISSIQGLVDQAVANWDGKDSQDFNHWWTGEHKGNLTKLQHAIDGLGQSAINNASEQRQVSGH